MAPEEGGVPGYGEDMGLHRLGLEVGLGGGWKWRSEVKIGSEGQVKFRGGGLAAGFHPVLAPPLSLLARWLCLAPSMGGRCWPGRRRVSLPLEQQRLQASRQCEGKGTLGSWKSVAGVAWGGSGRVSLSTQAGYS